MNRMLFSIMSFALLAVVGVVLHQRLQPTLQAESRQARFLPKFDAVPESQTASSLPPVTDAEGGFPAVNRQRLAELEKSNYQGPAYKEVLQDSGPRLAINEVNTERTPASEPKKDKKRKKTK